MNQKMTVSTSSNQWTNHNRWMNLMDGSTANENRVRIWECTSGTNQQFTHTTGPGTSTSTFKTIRPHKSSGTCLAASSNTDGASVVVQPCASSNNSTAQAWVQNGATLLVHGDKCLDVKDGSTANGAELQIWTCTPGQGNAAQQFTVTADKTIQWTGKGKCLDLTDGVTTSGTVQQTWDCSTGTPYENQIWSFI